MRIFHKTGLNFLFSISYILVFPTTVFFLRLVGFYTLLCVRLLCENQPWASPKVSEHSLAPPYSAMGQTSLRPRKSMSVDMGQPSQANAKKLLGISGLMASFFLRTS